MATKTESAKLLVICVDRDNDVGEKTGLETPVVGRNACIEAAQKLALEDPEDADSNAIFSAIKTYEDLISRGYEAQVIVVTGVERRGVQADEKIVAEIKSVLKTEEHFELLELPIHHLHHLIQLRHLLHCTF